MSREKGEVSGCSQPCQPGLIGLWGKAYQRGSLTPSVLTATVVRLSSLDPVRFSELSLTVVGRDVGIQLKKLPQGTVAYVVNVWSLRRPGDSYFIPGNARL